MGMSARHDKLTVVFKPEVSFELYRKVVPVFCGWSREFSIYEYKTVGFYPRESIIAIANDQIDNARESVESGE